MSEELVQRLRPPAGEAAGALVLLHGRGTDENDLFPLLDLLDPERRLLGATARGPLSLPPGGAHWYAVREIGYPDPPTFLETYPRLCRWLDGLLEEHGLGARPAGARRLLAGQRDDATRWRSGPAARAPRRVVALSGFMPTVEGFELDLSGRSGFRAAIGHGQRDPVIGVEWGRDARDRLTAAGADVLYEEHAGGHHVDPRFMAALTEYVAAA